jgi:antibiotic biosynthesis monooxygenase (ABM) superfamily enzyme
MLSLAEDGSHSMTNQAARYKAKSNQLSFLQKTHLKTIPRARLSTLILSKIYPTNGIHNRLLSMHGSKALGFLLLKAIKSKSLISYFSFQYSSSFNHSKWVDIYNQTWWKIINHPTSLIIAMVPLVTLCGRSIKQSQLPWETDDSNQIS